MREEGYFIMYPCYLFLIFSFYILIDFSSAYVLIVSLVLLMALKPEKVTNPYSIIALCSN